MAEGRPPAVLLPSSCGSGHPAPTLRIGPAPLESHYPRPRSVHHEAFSAPGPERPDDDLARPRLAGRDAHSSTRLPSGGQWWEDFTIPAGNAGVIHQLEVSRVEPLSIQLVSFEGDVCVFGRAPWRPGARQRRGRHGNRGAPTALDAASTGHLRPALPESLGVRPERSPRRPAGHRGTGRPRSPRTAPDPLAPGLRPRPQS